MASAITYEMVAQVCDQLHSDGENPTYLKLHERLGQGSTRVVSAHLRRWREIRASSMSGSAGRVCADWPEGLRLRAQNFFDALREVSAEAVAADITAARQQMALREEELSVVLRAAQEAREAALDTLRNEQATVHRLQVELESVRETLEAQRSGIEDLVEQREGIIARCSTLEQRGEAMQREHEAQLRELGGRAELERERQGDEIRKERERFGEEVRKEQARAAGEREHLMRQTDQLRQDYATQVHELRGKLAGVEQKEARQRQRAEEAEGLLREQAAELRQVEALAAVTGQRAEMLQAEVTALKDAGALHLARISALEARLALMEEMSAREAIRAEKAEARLEQFTRQSWQSTLDVKPQDKPA